MSCHNLLAFTLLTVSGLGCGGAPRRVLLPPRLDLAPFGHVGLARFTVEKAKGELDQLATQRFSEDILAAQPGIEVLELGSADSVRKRVGEGEVGPATVQALGAARGIRVVLVGHPRSRTSRRAAASVACPYLTSKQPYRSS